MNGYERIMAVLAGKHADRPPMMLHCFMPAAQEAGYTMEEYRNHPRKVADAHIRFAEKYGMDGILMDIDTCMEASAIGVPVDYPRDEPARTLGNLSTDFDVLKQAIVKEKLYQSKRIEHTLEAVRIMKNKVGKDLLVRGNCDQAGFSLAMLAYGMNDFMADLLDEDIEDSLIDLIDQCTDFHIEYINMMTQAGADVVSFGDSSSGPDLIGRNMYMKYANPSHRRIAKAAKKMNIPIVCHICGNLDLILEDVAASGFSAVEVDYKTNIHAAAEAFKKHGVVLFGPLDPSGLFFFGSPDKVYQETTNVLNIFRGSGIVVGAGCALPRGTPEQNIRSFVQAVLDYAPSGCGKRKS